MNVSMIHKRAMRSIKLDCNAALILLGNIKCSPEIRNAAHVVGMQISRIADDNAEIFSASLHDTITALVVGEAELFGTDWIGKRTRPSITLERVGGIVHDALESLTREFYSELRVRRAEDLLLSRVVSNVWNIRCFEYTRKNALFDDRTMIAAVSTFIHEPVVLSLISLRPLTSRYGRGRSLESSGNSFLKKSKNINVFGWESG